MFKTYVLLLSGHASYIRIENTVAFPHQNYTGIFYCFKKKFPIKCLAQSIRLLIGLSLFKLHNAFKLCGKTAALFNAKIDKFGSYPWTIEGYIM